MWSDFIDPEMQAAMARAYNRWGHEMREASDNHVHISCPVPILTTSRVRSKRSTYAYDELGVRCFWTRPNSSTGRNLGDRYYDPIWELLQDLDCAFATHEFMGLKGISYGHDRYNSFIEWHTAVHRWRRMGAMPVDDRARRVRALPPPARRRTWKPAAAGCRRGCTASTSTSSSPDPSSPTSR